MIIDPFVRSPYNYDVDAASNESGLLCEDKTLAKQEFADECDINTIVRRFGLTGQLPVDVAAPTYADFTEVYDFHSAMNAVAKAHESFDAMPAEVRARFSNDPGAFVDFCSNEANREEAIKLGLIVPAAPPAASPPVAPSVSVDATSVASPSVLDQGSP